MGKLTESLADFHKSKEIKPNDITTLKNYEAAHYNFTRLNKSLEIKQSNEWEMIVESTICHMLCTGIVLHTV
ncbi:hypothetical protein C2G38_2060933 [Gigaspora rosea]|uniref:Uncharacterized protein n=1 Tax=Gigaspora rosea TaxID=44941 RepID=A0A397W193_9GLOM|nr:hypothetical protein C2G38_2060933 [Gigaspora rosea]